MVKGHAVRSRGSLTGTGWTLISAESPSRMTPSSPSARPPSQGWGWCSVIRVSSTSPGQSVSSVRVTPASVTAAVRR